MSIAEIVTWIALSLVLVFPSVELITRWWLRRFGRYYVWAPGARTRMELDPRVFPTLDPVARFEINEDGERGDPPPRNLSDTYRVVVAGGSATECYYLDQAASWPRVLQRELSRPRRLSALGAERVHVGNIGRSLAATQHLCRMLSGVLPRYDRLDAIVLMVGASDVIRWLERRTPQVIEEREIPAGQVFAEHPEGPFGWSPRELALRRVARHWYRRVRRPVEVRRQVGKRLASCRAMRGRANHILDFVPSPQPMLDHFEKNLRRLIAIARANSTRVIVVHQPWFDKRYTREEEGLMWGFGAGCPHTEDVKCYYSHAVVWRLLRQVNARAARIVRETGVEEIDLMPALDPSVETYYDELHHTPHGCAVIGHAIAEHILRGARTPNVRGNVIKLRRSGDFARASALGPVLPFPGFGPPRIHPFPRPPHRVALSVRAPARWWSFVLQHVLGARMPAIRRAFLQ